MILVTVHLTLGFCMRPYCIAPFLVLAAFPSARGASRVRVVTPAATPMPPPWAASPTLVILSLWPTNTMASSLRAL
jgi:hypothetical protein